MLFGLVWFLQLYFKFRYFPGGWGGVWVGLGLAELGKNLPVLYHDPCYKMSLAGYCSDPRDLLENFKCPAFGF